MKVPLLDLHAQYQGVRDEIRSAVDEVFESQHFILGPAVQACEKAIAEYSGCKHGVGVSSGTDALLAVLMAEGIRANDEVITTPYTFFATAGCIARLGARPVFVDIDPATFNINPHLIEQAITSRTKAIMPVHLYGQCADMDPILAVAAKHNLVVIEDAAQAIGSEYKGRRAGSMGHYGCFSFFPSKNLGCAGDGGMVTTNDPAKAERVALIRTHGSKPKYFHKVVGGNFRLDALQAAVVSVKLKHLDDWTRGRQKNALRYNKLFQESGLAGGPIGLPRIPKSTEAQADGRAPSDNDCKCRHIFNQYVIRAKNRDGLIDHLKKCQVGTEIYYPVPMHEQECFAYLGVKAGSMPESEKAARETLALPVFPELTDEQAEYVVTSISRFYAGQ